MWGLFVNWVAEIPIKASIGNVPRAKKNIINAPVMMFPEVSANPWAVIVNPQGRKNVNAPIIKGIYLPLKLFSSATYLEINFGIVIWNLWNALTPNICKARANIIIDTAIVNIEVKVMERLNSFPMLPKTPPKIKKESNLPKLNKIFGCTRFANESLLP